MGVVLSCECCLVPPPPDEDASKLDQIHLISDDNYLEFVPADDQADMIDGDDEILTIEFLDTQANTKAPLYEELKGENLPENLPELLIGKTQTLGGM